MEYKYKWYIPDAYLHSRGTGYFTSHEGCAFINETDRDAHVRFFYACFLIEGGRADILIIRLR